ncbi:MAG: class I SAM-dependent methyltransferase [Candidatus Aminicenantales bacterium]
MKKKESRDKSNKHFRLMALSYKVRDFFAPRKNVLTEAGIKEGSSVLDFGCGPGSYIGPLAKMVGPSGKIFALDVHPLAIQMVERLADRKRLGNVTTIKSDCRTGLPGNSLDVILLYDVLHEFEQPGEVLQELHRVLKPTGILSVSDHHLKEDQIVSRLTQGGLFRVVKKGKKTYSFQIHP